MKTIVAGSRTIPHFITIIILDSLDCGFDITEVVSGTAQGVDRAGEWWGEKEDLPVTKFPADWETYGKAAGYRRNVEMAEYADALVAIWDGKSRGTKHMIDIAKKEGLLVHVVEVT